MARVDELEREVKSLRAENQALRAQLNRNSGNSSQPPSSDPLWTPRGAGPPRRGRSRGGQPGHKGRKRDLVEADEVVAIKPAQCGHCGEGLRGEDSAPHRHQVAEVPVEIRARVTEYQVHALSCERCGHETKATLPPEVPRTAVGPHLQAILGVLAGAYRLSKRNVRELARDVFGVTLSLGAISQLEARTSQALRAAHIEAAQSLSSTEVTYADETSWSKRNRPGWLWVQASRSVARFLIRRGRGADVAKELLGDFNGTLVGDGYSAYSFVPLERRQLCWAHIIRQLVGFRDHGPREKTLATKLLAITRKVFRAWHSVRDGTRSRQDFVEQMEPAKEAFHRLLQQGRWLPSSKVALSCRWLVRRVSALWTFVTDPNVEPTNNHAERVLRTGVLWRKTSFGTNSDRGDRFAERMLTVVQTLRLQARNVLAFVTQACAATLGSAPLPKLIPHQG